MRRAVATTGTLACGSFRQPLMLVGLNQDSADLSKPRVQPATNGTASETQDEKEEVAHLLVSSVCLVR
jgi:hypothetical protein